MTINDDDARAALAAAEAGRQAVADEVGAPAWYWWGLGVAWIVLGAIADAGIFWLATVATIAVGAVHAAVFAHVASGRHRSRGVSVRREVAGERTMLRVWLLLVALIAVGVAFSLVVAHDGAAHPAIIGSVLPAGIVVAGGPSIMRRSARRSAQP